MRKLYLLIIFIFTLSIYNIAYGKVLINVKDFGAKGDNYSDDINAFEEAVASLKEWGTLYIPPGEYRLSKTLIIKNKKRVNIISEGVIKPHGNFDDYLIEITNEERDSLIPSMGSQLSIRGLKFDCEWKSRGVRLHKIYDSNIIDLEIWRPYGTGISTTMLQEVSFIKPVIFAARPRYNDKYKRNAEEWDSRKFYKKGDIIKKTFNKEGFNKSLGIWKESVKYQKGDIIFYGEYPYRAIKESIGQKPSDSIIYWEKISIQYFMAIKENINEDPWDSIRNYTTRGGPPKNSSWKPIFIDEPAWSLVGEGEKNTIDNVKVWNFISRSNATPVVLRIDNVENIPPLKIEFYAPQFHAITKAYVEAFNNGNYGWKISQDDEVLQNGRLIEIISVSGLRIIGGQIQLGNIDKMKGIVFGVPGKGANISNIIFIGTHLESTGRRQAIISIQESVVRGKVILSNCSINLKNKNDSVILIDINNIIKNTDLNFNIELEE